jgi:hypothetical protein
MFYKKGKGHQQQLNIEVKKELKEPNVGKINQK